MNFRFRTRIEFLSPPSNVVALDQAPQERESMLATGHWLVLSFAVWSAPDIRAVEESLTFARQAEGMRVGVRPFDEHHEHESWAPHVLEEAGSPIWTLWTDGVPRGVLVGTIDAVRLAAWVRRELGDGGRSG